MHQPELIFLDEPSTGLDPQSRRNLRNIVENIKEEGKTIILTTHSMEEAQHLCDEIAIMDQGMIIAEGTPNELIRTYCRTSTLTLPVETLASRPIAAEIEWTPHEDRAVIHTDSIDRTIEQLTARNISLTGLSIHNPTLEDVFLHLTGRTLRD